MKKILALLLALTAVLSLAACQPQEQPKTLSEMLTAHQWRHLTENTSDDFGYRYDFLVNMKEDGTWTCEMNNSFTTQGSNTEAKHTIPGTWELNGSTLTIEMKDEEESLFNETDTFQFAEDVNDNNILQKQYELIVTGPPDETEGKLRWYVSDKYLFVCNFLFTAV